MSVRDVVQAAAGALGGAGAYVEDVFSTYLYTGNGSTQTITNGIDLDGEGGMVWIKNRQRWYFCDKDNQRHHQLDCNVNRCGKCGTNCARRNSNNI